jgi:hypothetical protein
MRSQLLLDRCPHPRPGRICRCSLVRINESSAGSFYLEADVQRDDADGPDSLLSGTESPALSELSSGFSNKLIAPKIGATKLAFGSKAASSKGWGSNSQ